MHQVSYMEGGMFVPYANPLSPMASSKLCGVLLLIRASMAVSSKARSLYAMLTLAPLKALNDVDYLSICIGL